MKKILNILSLIMVISITFISCKKEEDEGLLPTISFNTGGNYTSASKTVGMNEAVVVGINAAKSEDEDVLKKFTAKVSYNGGTDSILNTQDLSGSNGDNFAYDQAIMTRNVAGTEKYTFTVVNRDGLVNSVELTLTVQ
jgi:hypothetical protein